MKFWRFLIVLFLCIPAIALAGTNYRAFLVTYGSSADPSEGDPDFKQVIFVHVPLSAALSVSIALFDAECGGEHDSSKGLWDTSTKFSLYGGAGITTSKTIREHLPTPADLTAGTLLASRTLGFAPILDNRWTQLGRVQLMSGERVGNEAVFKIVIEGQKGDDGNAFDVGVFLDEGLTREVAGARVLSYAPTVRIDDDALVAELRLRLNDGTSSVLVNNFDLGGAIPTLEGPFRGYAVAPLSDQGNWVASKVDLDGKEKAAMWALQFGGGREVPNDAAFYFRDDKDAPLAIELPIRLIKINKRPEPSFKFNLLSYCGSVAFDASASKDPEGDPLDYIWDFGDGTTAAGMRVIHHYDPMGLFNVTLMAHDKSGIIADGSKKTIAVLLNKPPIAVAGKDKVSAPNESLSFSGLSSSDSDGKIKSYAWDFGDGEQGVGANVEHSYTSPGRYTVTLKVEDDGDAPCNGAQSTASVWVNQSPVAKIVSVNRAPPKEPVAFSGARSEDADGKLVSYVWDFGDGGHAEGMEVSHIYGASGTYVVTLKVTDDAGVSNSSATTKSTILINWPPQAVAESDKRRVAAGEVLRFDGSKSTDKDGHIVDYVWEFGDGSGSHGPSVNHAYTRPGDYKAKLTVVDNSAMSSGLSVDYVNVHVNKAPLAIAGTDKRAPNSQVTFDARLSKDEDGKVVAYEWNFGDGDSSRESTPTHLFGNTGLYRVGLRATDDSDTPNRDGFNQISVWVNTMPVADAGATRMVAPGEVVSFSGATSIDPDGQLTSYDWSFGDGATAKGLEVFHAYSEPGNYSVRLTVRDDSGFQNALDIDALVVTVNAPPVAKAGKDRTIAVNEPTTFDGKASYDGDGGPLTYSWVFNDGETYTNTKFTRVFKEPGVYIGTLTVTDSSGARNNTASDTVLIMVNHPPRANPGPSVATCDTAILFDGTRSTDSDSDRLSYVWDFGDGSTRQAGSKAYHTYSQPGTYPVMLTVDDNTGLSSSKGVGSMVVSINKPPIANAGGDKTVCAGEVTLFNGGNSRDPENGPLKYTWDLGEGIIARGLNPSRTYGNGGVFLVTLTVEDDSNLSCNKSMDQIVVRVAESPVSVAGPDQNVCANTEVHFDGTKSRDSDGLVNSFSWDFADGLNAGGPTPTHIFAKPGVYKVVLTVTGDLVGECDNTARDEVVITVYDAPSAKYTVPKVVAVKDVVAFNAIASAAEGSKIASYLWDFGDMMTGSGEKVEHSYEKPGKYFTNLVVATDAQTSCSKTAAQNLIIVNAQPVAKAAGPHIGAINQMLVFDGSASGDSDGSITSYNWDFGDGATAVGVESRHEYKKSGKYIVSLKVTDDTSVKNNTHVDTFTLIVNDPPKPVITEMPQLCAKEPAKFSGAKSTDLDGQIINYLWSFGDMQTGTGADVFHTYASPGHYQTTLQVDDGTNVPNSRIQTSILVTVNSPPIANGGREVSACAGEEIDYDGSASFDADGVLTYHWDFGDETSADGKTASHTYAAPGTYDARLRVVDDSGTSCGVSEDPIKTFINAPPIARLGGDKEAYAGGNNEAILFDGTQSEDPDGGRLTYFWDFGDGITEIGAKVMHNFVTPGTYLVRLKVRDESGTKCNEGWGQINVNVRTR